MRALIVDDDELSLDLLKNVLDEMHYEVDCAHNGKEALEKLRSNTIHLVITDWEMPEMNGIELCRAIRAEDFDGYVYVIMLTGREGRQQKIDGIQGGADAFINKPLNPDELLVCLKTAQRILALETRDLAMFALAKLSESRDPETGAHIERVQSYARMLAQYLSTTEKYCEEVDTEFVRLIFQTTPLHDIGKVAIPDRVLLKPGKLDDSEIAIMRTHAAMGAQTIEASLQRFPHVRFLQMARDIAMSHHERWDGQGYPNRLRGKDIPLAARIVALADVYDALTSRRVYRDAISHGAAKQLIIRERSGHFDADVVDAFLHIEMQFIAVRERFRDVEHDSGTNAVAAALAAAVAGNAQQSGSDKRTSVMIVDDDPIIRDMIANYLSAHAIDCVSCSDGMQALQMLDAHEPQVIISDWQMPELDGLELCRRVRSRNSGGQHVHFIMLTVLGEENDLARAFDAGVDDFLSKPFNGPALMARLRAAFRAISLYEEISRRHKGSAEINEQLASMNQRLEKLAITDDLTGLYNRRQAMHRLEEHWLMCDRYQRPVAVVCLDIDHFKQINDRYGHPAGDEVLRVVSAILRSCVRSTDTVCRVGGEEFLIILPCQTLHEAEICAQRCRQEVSMREFEFGDLKIRATISAGIASRRGDMTACTQLLQDADEALYAAKHAGRNMVCSAPTPPELRPKPTAA